MSDQSVRDALRSDLPMVLVEAPAGCGKTHQGADYARDIADLQAPAPPLIVTHTHAACAVFGERATKTKGRVEIRTIDSLITQIASAYHTGLGLPLDVPTWARSRRDGFQELASLVCTLVTRHPMIAGTLARRHRTIICDEHQDATPDQHSLVACLLGQGARVRIFADPMQRIFRDVGGDHTWEGLVAQAQAVERLDVPHRWITSDPELGHWTLRAREALRKGDPVDLRQDLPKAVVVTFAENKAQGRFEYRLDGDERRPIDLFHRNQASHLILTRFNETARALCSFFARTVPLWEGHTRDALGTLAQVATTSRGDPGKLAAAIVAFMSAIGKGFSPSAFGNRFEREARDRCTSTARGLPAVLQDLARLLVAEPDHKGVAKVLRRLTELKKTDRRFADLETDGRQEFWDAIRLGDFESSQAGLSELARRRSHSRPTPPPRAISTIHKAKGLQCESVQVMPCDRITFPDKPDARCLLYVALSRARRRLMLVVSRENPSPLFLLPPHNVAGRAV